MQAYIEIILSTGMYFVYLFRHLILLQCVFKHPPGRCNYLQCGNMYQCGNGTGPKTDPFGTPDRTGTGSEAWPSNTTF